MPVVHTTQAKHASRQIGTQAVHDCPLQTICSATGASIIACDHGTSYFAGGLPVSGMDAEDVIEEQEARPAETKVVPSYSSLHVKTSAI